MTAPLVKRKVVRKKLKVIDQGVSDCVQAHRKERKKSEKMGERCEYHRQRLKYVDDAITMLERELRAGEQAALERERLEQQREIELKAKDKYRAANVQAAAQVPQPKASVQQSPQAPPSMERPQNMEDTSNSETGAVAVVGEQVSRELDVPEEEAEVGAADSIAVVESEEVGLKPDQPPEPEVLDDSAAEAVVINGGGETPALSEEPSKGSKDDSKPSGLLKSSSEGAIVPPDPAKFSSEKELRRFRQEAVRKELVKCAGSPLEAFKAINLNGSGNICSNDFAEGVKRLGVPWQELTGFTNQRQLFKIFDLEKTGVITFYELFPTERDKPRDDSGMTTPDFWRRWVKQNHGMEKGCGGATWHPGTPEAQLALMFAANTKNEESAVQHKWISKTFRKFKSRGKSDARCREMVALHLPHGTGSEDMQGVKLFSDLDVKQVRRGYNDAVNEPQRNITKAIEDLREQRHELHASRTHLFHVAVEPHLKQQKADQAKKNFGGLSLGLHHHHDDEEPAAQSQPHPEKAEAEDEEQASFNELANKTGMELELIEDVFRVWMRHSDKTEQIMKKQFQRLLEDLCPHRTLVNNDLNAWWDQVHGKGHAEVMTVDWTAADDFYQSWRKASLGAEGRRDLTSARKSPVTFDQFITWWASSEMRHT
jgi:hypothetical protein